MARYIQTFIHMVLLQTILLILFPMANVQAGDSKPPLTHADYDSWRSIYEPQISPDGKWIYYVDTPQHGDAVLVAKNPDQNIEYRYVIGFSGEGTDAEQAAEPQIAFNSSHLAFLISPPKAQVDSIRKIKKENKKNNRTKPVLKLGIMTLSDGRVTVIDSVKSFKMPEEASGWLAYLMDPGKTKEPKEVTDETKEKSEKSPEKKPGQEEKKKDYGAPLILQSLIDSTKRRFESVLDYRFTKNGAYLLYVVSSKEKPETDGVYAVVPGDSISTPLLTGQGNYKGWQLNKRETRMAFFTDRDDYQAKRPVYDLYGWKVGDRQATLWVSHRTTKGMPSGMSVSDKSTIVFTEDGSMVMFGIKEVPDTSRKSDDEEQAKFDLWHWNDPYPQPQQKKLAERVRDNAWEAIYFVDSNKFVKLADEQVPDVQLASNGKIAYANNPWPYTKRVSWEGIYHDVYEIDPKTGERTLVKSELYGSASLSPQGKYLYWFENNHWFVYDIKTNKTVNITEPLKVRFEREDWDTPEPARPYGVAGWTDQDKSLLIYDRYDIWEIYPDGSNARSVTENYGRNHQLSFRYIKLDPEEPFIDPNKPMLLSATNQETMASGFYLDRVTGNYPPVELLMIDKSFERGPIKAKFADRLLFSRSSFDEFPDLWISDLNFKKMQKVTDLGSQMNPFRWGKAELREFLSTDGKPLKGILIKPDDFDANQKYPLLVHIYETQHESLHRFIPPGPGTSINLSYYVSNGYIIWQPDIEYGTGYPGQDALKCVLPGIHLLIREGYVDPARIGIQGHSWGGYQIAYMVTQSHIFAAAVAGAPVCNMISAYNGIRWESGMVRQFQYERTQSRLGASLWEAPMRYIENSPIFWADKVQTPLLMIHNDDDGAVPWYQGIEYIMALRRLGKEAYMFNYNGEGHGLKKRVNQKDWTIRMQEFFDHFLKGAPATDWMKNGIKAWEKELEPEGSKSN